MLQIVPNTAMRMDTVSRNQFKRVSDIDSFSLNSCKWQISGKIIEIVKLNKAPSKDYEFVNTACIQEPIQDTTMTLSNPGNTKAMYTRAAVTKDRPTIVNAFFRQLTPNQGSKRGLLSNTSSQLMFNGCIIRPYFAMGVRTSNQIAKRFKAWLYSSINAKFWVISCRASWPNIRYPTMAIKE